MAVRAGSGEERGIEAAVKLCPTGHLHRPGIRTGIRRPGERLPGHDTERWCVQEAELGRRLRALQLDPLLAEAHVAMGVTHTAERDFENAKSFENALKLNPNLTQAHGVSRHTRAQRDTKNGHCSFERAMTGPPVAHRAAGSRIRAVPQWPLRGRNRESAKVMTTDPEFPVSLYSRVR